MTLRRLRIAYGLNLAEMARALSPVPGARLSLRAYYLLERGRANDNQSGGKRRSRGINVARLLAPANVRG